MKSEVITITPAIAQMLLKRNTSNRRLSELRVDGLALAMTQDKFKFNGDSIRVSETGVLLDGQHRLSAIVKSGKPQEMLLVTGLPDDVFTTIDIGSARSTSDFLSIKAMNNPVTLAAAAVVACAFDTYGFPETKNARRFIIKEDIYLRSITDLELQEASDTISSNKALRKLYSPSYVIWCFYLFCKKDKVKAVSFMHELACGETSYKNSPVTALRNPLVLGDLRKDNPNKVCAYFFRAFRAYLAHEELKVIRFGDITKDCFLL